MGDCPLKLVDWRSSQSTANPDFSLVRSRKQPSDFTSRLSASRPWVDFPGKLGSNRLPYLDLPFSNFRNPVSQPWRPVINSSNGVLSPRLYCGRIGLMLRSCTVSRGNCDANSLASLKKVQRRPVAPTIKLNGPSSTVVRGRFAFQGHDLRRRSDECGHFKQNPT